LLHDGMIVVGVPYTEPRLTNMAEITGGTAYGATTFAGLDGSREPSENELAIARFQGRHVTEITNALVAGRKSETSNNLVSRSARDCSLALER
jgi:NAD(P)H dehydrogenase (quinone)